MRLTAAVTVQGNWYVAQCLEVDVASQGETLDESLVNLKEALELYFEDSDVAPSPAPIIAPVEISLG